MLQDMTVVKLMGGTEKAVKNLQKAHGLVQDGIVGKRAWRILLGM